jgi:hypothetical protein
MTVPVRLMTRRRRGAESADARRDGGAQGVEVGHGRTVAQQALALVGQFVLRGALDPGTAVLGGQGRERRVIEQAVDRGQPGQRFTRAAACLARTGQSQVMGHGS